MTLKTKTLFLMLSENDLVSAVFPVSVVRVSSVWFSITGKKDLWWLLTYVWLSYNFLFFIVVSDMNRLIQTDKSHISAVCFLFKERCIHMWAETYSQTCQSSAVCGDAVVSFSSESHATHVQEFYFVYYLIRSA